MLYSCTHHFHSHLSFVKSLKSVVDCKHFVAFGDSHSDSGAHGGVHTCRGGADVQHGDVKGALWVRGSSGHKGESKARRHVLRGALNASSNVERESHASVCGHGAHNACLEERWYISNF